MSVPNLETESKLTNNLLRSLSKGYKLGTDRDQLKFLILAVYLQALGYEDESESISEYISRECDYTGNENTWHSVGHQVLMLARTKRLRGEVKESESLVQRIVNQDVVSDDITRVDFLAQELSDFKNDLPMLLEETPKWRCEGFVYMYLGLLYCREFAQVVPYEPIEQVEAKIEPKLVELVSLLGENLK
jgi:hypothetical protein